MLVISECCSCLDWDKSKKLCDAKNVVIVKILEYVDKSKNQWSEVRVAQARVQEYLKGEGEIGKIIQLESELAGAACGVGRSFNVGETLVVLDVENLEQDMSISYIASCDGRLYHDVDDIRDLMKNQDCTGKLARCKLHDVYSVLTMLPFLLVLLA